MGIHLLFSIHTNQLEAQIRFTESIGRYHGRQEYEKMIFNPRSLEEKIVTRSLERPVNRTPPPSTFDTIHLIDMKFGTYNKLHLYFQLSETTWCLIGFHGNNSHRRPPSWIFKFSDFVQIVTFVLHNDKKAAFSG